MNDRERMARLLAGANHPSSLERDALFQRVWSRVAPRQRIRWWGGLAGAVAAAAALVVFMHTPRDEFAARGAASSTMRAYCVQDCRAGDKLLFEAKALRAPVYVAAWARRSDGAIIWYFPAGSSTSPLIERDGILPEGAVLGPEHTPGRYELTLVISDRPLDRQQARAATVGADARSIDHVAFDVR